MAITPGDDIETKTGEPLPRGNWLDRTGNITRAVMNYFNGKDRLAGEIVSGVNRNRANIVQLETDYQAADGAVSSAYIAADAVVASDASSARATLETTLRAEYQAADSAIEGDVATNTAAITTEATARADGDSANATLISSTEARISAGSSGVENPKFDAAVSSSLPTGWDNWIAPGSTALAPRESGTGYCTRQVVAGGNNGGWRQQVNGLASEGVYTLRARIQRLLGSLTPAGVLLQWYDSGGGSLGTATIAFGTEADASGLVSTLGTGERVFEKVLTAPTSTSYALLYAMNQFSFFGSTAGGNTINWHELDLVPSSNTEAKTFILQDAFIGSDGLAIAKLTLEAAAGGGNPARIGLRDSSGGSSIALVAEQIFFGSETVFEDTYNTLYTEDGGGYRLRILGPFPASGDLVIWYGADSVALNSETKTNGVFALATDGKVYFGSNDLSNEVDGMSLPMTGGFYSGASGSDKLTGNLNCTATNTTGTVSYLWTCSDPAVSFTAPTSATTKAQRDITSTVTAVARCLVTDSSGSKEGSAQARWTVI